MTDFIDVNQSKDIPCLLTYNKPKTTKSKAIDKFLIYAILHCCIKTTQQKQLKTSSLKIEEGNIKSP